MSVKEGGGLQKVLPTTAAKGFWFESSSQATYALAFASVAGGCGGLGSGAAELADGGGSSGLSSSSHSS